MEPSGLGKFLATLLACSVSLDLGCIVRIVNLWSQTNLMKKSVSLNLDMTFGLPHTKRVPF